MGVYWGRKRRWGLYNYGVEREKEKRGWYFYGVEAIKGRKR